MEPISFEEYEAAYRRFVACLHETGVGITEYGLDPEHRQFSFATEPDKSTGDPLDEECYEREYADANERWQYQQSQPHAKETFDRAVKFFAERGVREFPAGYAESGSLGGLIQHAVSVLGEQISHDYSESEQSFEARQRAGGLQTEAAPEPWKGLASLAVGGLLAIGFSEDGRYCLIVSHAGRSVLDLTTGEEVERDGDYDLDSFVSRSRLVATGVGPLDGLSISIAGLFGGGLPLSTEDGWWVFRIAPEVSDERIVLQAPDANIYNSFKGLTQIATPAAEVRAVGFTSDGATLVLATKSNLQIWRRADAQRRHES